jgi:hypothetical protein
VYTGFWWVNQKEEYHLEDRGVDGRIVLICIFRKRNVEYGLHRSGSEQVADTCECGNEPSGSIKFWGFLD